MSVPHVLLRLIAEGPSHGYELHRRLARFGAYYPLTNVNVYPSLRDLEQEGFVTSRRELADSRMRKVYEITPAGERELERWIGAAPDGPGTTDRDLVALKLALALPGHRPELGWLEESAAELEEKIARSRQVIERQRASAPSSLAMLAAEYRLRSDEHRCEFFRHALRIARGADAAPARTFGKRVLVVDDSIAARVLSSHLLSAAGYEVHLAEDGAQAWERLQHDAFDAVVSDALMPEIDGFELLQRVRSHAGLAHLPVILNTVLEEPGRREAALAAGATDYVCKGEAGSGRRLVDSVKRITGARSLLVY